MTGVRTTNASWLILVGLTCLSYFVAEGNVAPSGAWVVLGLIFVKLGLIQAFFMELIDCRPVFLRVALFFDLLLLGCIGVMFL